MKYFVELYTLITTLSLFLKNTKLILLLQLSFFMGYIYIYNNIYFYNLITYIILGFILLALTKLKEKFLIKLIVLSIIASAFSSITEQVDYSKNFLIITLYLFVTFTFKKLIYEKTG